MNRAPGRFDCYDTVLRSRIFDHAATNSYGGKIIRGEILHLGKMRGTNALFVPVKVTPFRILFSTGSPAQM